MPGNNDYKVGVPDMETEIATHGTGFATVWKVPYTVTDGPAKGTKGHVSIPTDEYEPNAVHGAIQKAVAVHQQVMGA
jgi:hypothetical protein